MPRKFQTIPEEVIVDADQVEVKTEVKKISRAKAKAIVEAQEGIVKPKRQMTEKQMENWKKVLEINKQRKQEKLEALKKAEEEAKAEAERKLKEDLASGKKLKVQVKAPRPRKQETSVKLPLPPSDEELASDSDPEPPKAKPKVKPVRKQRYDTEDDEETELSEVPTDLEKSITKKRVLVPKAVKEKVQAIKAIDSQIKQVNDDPHGFRAMIQAKWKR